jgi:hypothetical protein
MMHVVCLVLCRWLLGTIEEGERVATRVEAGHGAAVTDWVTASITGHAILGADTRIN